MSIVKEKTTNRKTRGDSARRLNLVTPSGTETGSRSPDQLKFWQTMLDSLESVAMLLRRDTREIVACNKAAREQGVTPGKTCFQSWAKRENPCTWCRASEVWETGETIHCQPEDDGRIWDTHWVSISDDLYLHYVRDITDEKRAEKQLKASDQRFAMLVESAPVAFYETDAQGKCLYVNEKWRELAGLTLDEALGDGWKEGLHKEDRPHLVQLWSEHALNHESWDMEYRFCTPDGKVSWVMGRATALRDADGQVTGYLGANVDITERKKAEEALLASKAKFQGYIDNAPDGLLVANGQGRFLEANPATCEMLGYSEEELLQLTIPEVLAPESQEDGRKHFAQVVGDGSAHGEFVGLRKDGSTFYYIVDAVRVNEDRFMGFIKDISVRRTAELALMSQTHDLGERIKELGGLYGLSRLTTDKDLNPEQVFQQAAELLPPAWHYPEITCGRIVISDQEYVTDNYANTAWKQSTEILVAGTPVGIIEVAYVEEMPEMFEGPFMREERNLINGMAQILGQYIERVQHESRLRESNARLIEGQLALESKNTTLNEIIEHVDREKKDAGLLIQSNIDKVVMPLVEKLKIGANSGQIDYLNLLGTNLRDVASPFIGKLEAQYARLSPREVEICKMLINGMTSKEIATALNTSVGTVFNQRKTIRKKLGIASDNINLVSFLKTI